VDLTHITIDEVVLDGVSPSAPDLPIRIQAALAAALRERGVAEKATGRTAEHVSTEVMRRIDR